MKALGRFTAVSQAREKARLSTGFSLLELLVTITIIAILGALAYPTYERHRQRIFVTEAKLALAEVAALQAQYFAKHRRYTVDLVSQLGMETEMGRAISGSGNYYITGEPCADNDLRLCCKFVAAPAVSGNITLTLDTNGRKHPPEAWK